MVEAVLTLPLIVFLILGTLQLFLMLQARLLTQYAAYRAVRAGSLNRGSCRAMMHSAIVNLLPTLERTDDPKSLADAFIEHSNNRHSHNGYTGHMVEIVREGPLPDMVRSLGSQEDLEFDLPSQGPPRTLEIRLLYWYYMKLPFANWTMSKLFLAHYGLRSFSGYSPLMPLKKDAWQQGANQGQLDMRPWPGGNVGATMRGAANGGHYVFPIIVTSAMRMMTPALKARFAKDACELNGTGP